MTTPVWLRNWRKERVIRRFQKAGFLPWTRGYEEHKAREIARILEAGTFQPQHLPPNYGFRLDERLIEIPWVFARIPPTQSRLLDAGSALNQEIYLSHPSLAQKNIHILTLAPEKYCAWKSGVSYLFGDLRATPYRDGWFDEIVCISTLEHVGMDNTRLYTADPTFRENSPQEAENTMREFRRILRPGGHLWLTFPYGKSAQLGWLQVFDATAVKGLISAFAPQASQAWYFQYTHSGWCSADPTELASATYFDWHATRTYGPDFAAAARGVCCLELCK